MASSSSPSGNCEPDQLNWNQKLYFTLTYLCKEMYSYLKQFVAFFVQAFYMLSNKENQ